MALGHRPDAEAFIGWAERAARDEGQKSWGLQIAYGLHGQEELAERELVNLEGYRRSAPVRIGNAAGSQLQLNIYGELVAAAYALALSGRLDEASTLFEGMLARRNHLGLYSEEIDPGSGAFLGNFSQAYMHVGLITSSLYLADAEGTELPVPSLIGSKERVSERRSDVAPT